ncbi:MAG: hypothetical protein ABEH40_02135 [Haloferacaceae archaeon]
MTVKHEVAHFLRSCLPAWIVLGAYAAVLPLSGAPPWSALAAHQQLVQLAALPAALWSVYRYNAGLDDATPTPEERVLGDDGWPTADD